MVAGILFVSALALRAKRAWGSWQARRVAQRWEAAADEVTLAFWQSFQPGAYTKLPELFLNGVWGEGEDQQEHPRTSQEQDGAIVRPRSSADRMDPEIVDNFSVIGVPEPKNLLEKPRSHFLWTSETESKYSKLELSHLTLNPKSQGELEAYSNILHGLMSKTESAALSTFCNSTAAARPRCAKPTSRSSSSKKGYDYEGSDGEGDKLCTSNVGYLRTDELEWADSTDTRSRILDGMREQKIALTLIVAGIATADQTNETESRTTASRKACLVYDRTAVPTDLVRDIASALVMVGGRGGPNLDFLEEDAAKEDDGHDHQVEDERLFIRHQQGASAPPFNNDESSPLLVPCLSDFCTSTQDPRLNALVYKITARASRSSLSTGGRTSVSCSATTQFLRSRPDFQGAVVDVAAGEPVFLTHGGQAPQGALLVFQRFDACWELPVVFGVRHNLQLVFVDHVVDHVVDSRQRSCTSKEFDTHDLLAAAKPHGICYDFVVVPVAVFESAAKQLAKLPFRNVFVFLGQGEPACEKKCLAFLQQSRSTSSTTASPTRLHTLWGALPAGSLVHQEIMVADLLAAENKAQDPAASAASLLGTPIRLPPMRKKCLEEHENNKTNPVEDFGREMHKLWANASTGTKTQLLAPYRIQPLTYAGISLGGFVRVLPGLKMQWVGPEDLAVVVPPRFTQNQTQKMTPGGGAHQFEDGASTTADEGISTANDFEVIDYSNSVSDLHHAPNPLNPNASKKQGINLNVSPSYQADVIARWKFLTPSGMTLDVAQLQADNPDTLFVVKKHKVLAYGFYDRESGGASELHLPAHARGCVECKYVDPVRASSVAEQDDVPAAASSPDALLARGLHDQHQAPRARSPVTLEEPVLPEEMLGLYGAASW
eukprot:g14002.t1